MPRACRGRCRWAKSRAYSCRCERRSRSVRSFDFDGDRIPPRRRRFPPRWSGRRRARSELYPLPGFSQPVQRPWCKSQQFLSGISRGQRLLFFVPEWRRRCFQRLPHDGQSLPGELPTRQRERPTAPYQRRGGSGRDQEERQSRESRGGLRW